ncbi:MAG: histidine kinase dimerization/phospho-acceptor domain-containing protein, partial [Bacteroidales bacterium]
MNRRTVLYIAISMFIALLGLISVQCYWSYKVFRLNQEYFYSSVNEAMNEVLVGIEKAELSGQLTKHRKRQQIIQGIDSLNLRMTLLKQKYPEVSFEETKFWEDAYGNFILSTSQDTMSTAGLSSDLASFMQDSNANHTLNFRESRKIKKVYRLLAEQRDDLLRSSQLMEDLLLEAMKTAPQPEINQRISPYVLDSAIARELRKKEINTQMEWGIYSTEKSKLIIQKTGQYGVQLLLSPFYYQLYPGDKSNKPYYLSIYFPHQKAFLFSQTWYLALAAFFLFALQIFVFAYTLISILKQKKLAELKSDFINHITHEIKTPVSTISLICESFEDPDIHYDEQGIKNILRIIRHESDRLQSLSKQIIEISKLESGEYFLNKTSFDLHKAIEEAVNNTGFQVMHKNGCISTDFQASNPMINGDRIHIVHIISSIIDNANKYCAYSPKIFIS